MPLFHVELASTASGRRWHGSGGTCLCLMWNRRHCVWPAVGTTLAEHASVHVEPATPRLASGGHHLGGACLCFTWHRRAHRLTSAGRLLDGAASVSREQPAAPGAPRPGLTRMAPADPLPRSTRTRRWHACLVTAVASAASPSTSACCRPARRRSRDGVRRGVNVARLCPGVPAVDRCMPRTPRRAQMAPSGLSSCLRRLSTGRRELEFGRAPPGRACRT